MQPDWKVCASGGEVLGGISSLSTSIPPLRDRPPPPSTSLSQLSRWQHSNVMGKWLSLLPTPLSLPEGRKLNQKYLVHPPKTASVPRCEAPSLSRSQLYSTTFLLFFPFSFHPPLKTSTPTCITSTVRHDVCSIQ